VAAIALGVPMVFPLALPAAYVPDALRLAGSAGGVLVGGRLLACVGWLWPQLGGAWRLALACLAAKAVGQVVVAVVPGVDWAALHGLRVLYLHLMLLGFVSLGLVAASGVPARAFAAGVALLLGSLVLLTPVWPRALGGEWTYYVVAWAAVPAVVAAAALAVGRWRPSLMAPSRRPAEGRVERAALEGSAG
jgi:hypothetical protein